MSEQGWQVWNEKYQVIRIDHMNGTKKLNGTLNNAAAADAGDGYASIPITGHGLTAGTKIRIAGSTAYDGVHLILSVIDANHIKINKTYVVEEFAGSETYAVAINPTFDFQLVETRLVLADAANAENFVVALDADEGATYDCTLKTEDMDSLKQDIELWMTGEQHRYFEQGDVIYFEFANTADDAWTLAVIYRKKA
jgi:hypothetical protein